MHSSAPFGWVKCTAKLRSPSALWVCTRPTASYASEGFTRATVTHLIRTIRGFGDHSRWITGLTACVANGRTPTATQSITPLLGRQA